MLVDRAIAELALQAAADGDGEPGGAVLDEALRLRELLKFEFFFHARGTFESELAMELRLIGAAGDDAAKACTQADADRLLREADLLLAHLVLRPYLDAYHIVADRLAAHGDDLDEQRFLAECLGVGNQWQLQGRITSAESVSLELYKTALRLARHRDLVDGSGPLLNKRRREFAEQIAVTTRRVRQIAELARAAPR
jgi:glycerol-3-phosphate O-acyltransferase